MKLREYITGSRFYYVAAAVYLGFVSAIAQVLLIRELLTIFRGNEFIIGMIYTGWFIGIFFGARYNAAAETEKLERRVSRSLMLMPVALLVMVYLVHLTPIIFPRTVGGFYSITVEFLLSLLFTMPVSYFVGYFFPPVITLLSNHYGDKAGGFAYLIESLGAFAGGILFSFLLIDLLNPLATSAILMFFSCALYAFHRKKKYLWALLAIPVLLFHFSDEGERAIFKSLWARTQSGTLLTYARTRYQTIAVGFDERQISVYGDGVLYYSIPDGYETRPVFHLINSLRKDGNDEMLIFGAGPGSLPYNLVRSGVGALSYFEIDPKLWETIRPYRKRFYRTGEADLKLRVISQDLRRYLTTTEKHFDMMVCFPPVPHNAMINRFYTTEFYSLCRDRLSDNGIFITSIGGFSSYIDPEQRNFIASIYKGFSRVFPHNLVTSGDTIYLIGSKRADALPRDTGTLIAGYTKELARLEGARLEPEVLERYNPNELKGFFEPTRIARFRDTIGPALPGAIENRDNMPFAYWSYILYSAAREQSLLYHLLKHWEYFVAAIVLVSVFVLFGLKRRNGTLQFAGGAIIFTIGLVNMSVVLLMIMLYQNFYGVVYYRISLINALFMLGLTAGSYASNRLRLRSLQGVSALMILSLLCVFFFIHIRMEALFWLILFVFSLLCGTAFPALYLVLSRDGFHRAASNLDAMEFFGSIVGSVLITVLLPVIGIRWGLIFNIAVLIATLVMTALVKKLDGGGAARE